MAFTAVNEGDFRLIVRQLAENGNAPSWFAEIEYIRWRGGIKDLSFIPGIRPRAAILVDDFAEFAHPEQRSQLVKVSHFGHPYSEADRGLYEALILLEDRIRSYDSAS